MERKIQLQASRLVNRRGTEMTKLVIIGERVWREAIERKSDRGEERERWRVRGGGSVKRERTFGNFPL